jgi:hypothetical protein
MPEWLDSWRDVLQLIAIFQAAFVIGISLFIIHVYFHSTDATRYGKSIHVVMVAISYILLTLLTLRGVIVGVYSPPFREWFIAWPSLVTAFGLGDYALLQMVGHLRGYRQNHEHTD